VGGRRCEREVADLITARKTNREVAAAAETVPGLGGAE
jgi:hypothetical protein